MHRQLILGALAGLIAGLTIAGGVVWSQAPSWYQDTLQGQYEQRFQLDNLQFEQDLQRLDQRYGTPYGKSPC